MSSKVDSCIFCKLVTLTRGHHIIPRCKGGEVIVPSCETCEDFIHKTWSHNELRDMYNTVESIISTETFQKFLKWRLKQPIDIVFKSDRNKNRNKGKYS
jgi:hypothetical protein